MSDEYDGLDWGADALNEIWNTFADQLEGAELEEFEQFMADKFQEGYIDREIDEDTREEARQAFEDWLFEHTLDIADFDWDEWRDWYDS